LSAQIQTRFFTGSYAQLAQTAESQDKLFLLYFHADWVAPCRYLSESVWPDVAVAELLNRRFLIRRVELDQGTATELAQRFRVEQIPSILIFSANGLLIERIETALEAGELYRRLLELDVPAHHLNPIATIGRSQPAGEVRRAPQPSFRILPQLSQTPVEPEADLPATSDAIGYLDSGPAAERSAPEVFQARAADRYGWLVQQPFGSRAEAEKKSEKWIGETGVYAEVRERVHAEQSEFYVIFGPFRNPTRAETATKQLDKIQRTVVLKAW
jgi:hypothetical protein